jgi:diadenosine tetraphosphate (Ap4A) HIT family hydrolase
VWGERFGQSSDVIMEAEALLVVAGLGALTEGYVLLLPKAHYLSIGKLPQDEMSELVRVKDAVGSLIKRLYGQVVFFEHGMSSSNRGGGCTEHAHLHVCPCSTDFRPYLRCNFPERQISHLSELSEIAQADIPYLFYENVTGAKFVYPLSEHIPSQYLRKVWAQCVGKPQEWNWAEHIGEDNIARTIQRLRDALERS